MSNFHDVTVAFFSEKDLLDSPSAHCEIFRLGIKMKQICMQKLWNEHLKNNPIIKYPLDHSIVLKSESYAPVLLIIIFKIMKNIVTQNKASIFSWWIWKVHFRVYNTLILFSNF